MTEDNKSLEIYTENYKTIPCAYFLKYGQCKYNEKCSFAHGKDEIKKFNPTYKTSMCANIESKGECHSLYCSYAHSDKELKYYS